MTSENSPFSDSTEAQFKANAFRDAVGAQTECQEHPTSSLHLHSLPTIPSSPLDGRMEEQTGVSNVPQGTSGNHRLPISPVPFPFQKAACRDTLSISRHSVHPMEKTKNSVYIGLHAVPGHHEESCSLFFQFCAGCLISSKHSRTFCRGGAQAS